MPVFGDEPHLQARVPPRDVMQDACWWWQGLYAPQGKAIPHTNDMST